MSWSSSQGPGNAPPVFSPAGDFIGPAAPQPGRFPQSNFNSGAQGQSSPKHSEGRKSWAPGGGSRGAAGSCPTHRHCFFFLSWHLQPTPSTSPGHHCNAFLHLLTTAPASQREPGTAPTFPPKPPPLFNTQPCSSTPLLAVIYSLFKLVREDII